ADCIYNLLRFERVRAARILVIRILVELLIPLVATLEHQSLKGARNMVSEVVAVNVDWPVGPLAGQSQLPPGADIVASTARNLGTPSGAIIAAITLRSEDAIQLLYGQFGDGIVFIDDDGEGVIPSWYIEAPGHHCDLHRIPTEDTFKHQGFVKRDVPARSQ